MARPEALVELDMSGAAVDARLRQAAALSAAAPPSAPMVDMTAAAVSDRLRECAEISALADALKAAGEAAALGDGGPRATADGEQG